MASVLVLGVIGVQTLRLNHAKSEITSMKAQEKAAEAAVALRTAQQAAISQAASSKLSEAQAAVAADILTVIVANEEPKDWKTSIASYCESPIDQKQERVNKVLGVAAEHQLDNYVAGLLYSSRKQ